MSINKHSRTYNTIINTMSGLVATVVTIILNFVVRVILVRELGAEINGLHNLFQSIGNMVALLEAEISTAMIIHLYKPVKEKDERTIKEIMCFYQSTYICLAVLFAFVSLILDVFFIDNVVTTTISMSRVRVMFAVFMLSFVAKYLTYHKRSILYAEQKNRISVLINMVCELIFRTLEIVSIIVFHQYFIFLGLMIAESITSNMICSVYVNKNHPYLRNYKGVKTPAEVKKSILSKVKPMFVNRLSSTLQQSSKSILLSMILGNISIVGCFGNYQLVQNTVQSLCSQMGGAFTSSFGNLAVENEKERMYQAYRKVTFVMNSIAVIICVGFVCCIQDFIYIVFGADYVLDISCVFILALELLIYIFSLPVISIQNALGLHNKDKNQMVIQAIMAIVMGYLFGSAFGMMGILIGLMIPYFIFTLLYKGVSMHKIVFDRDTLSYIGFIVIELGKAIIILAIAFGISISIDTQWRVVDLILKGICAIIVSGILLFVFSLRNMNFYSIKKLILKVRR